MNAPKKPSNEANKDDAESLSWSGEDPSDLEDRELVVACLSDDATAFGRLFEKYRERIFRVLFGVVRNREDALEATQEVFVKIHRALPRFDPKGRFFTWAYRIAVNQGIDHLRQRKTRKELPLDPGGGVIEPSTTEPTRGGSAQPGPVVELERKEILQRVEEAIEGLSEDQRAVFMLYSFEGMSYGEIAETTGVPIGTVMSRLFYARKKVKERLPGEWDPGGPKRRERRS